MPIYPYHCEVCGKDEDVYAKMDSPAPKCCDGVMTRRYNMGNLIIRMGYPAWVDRMEEIGKRQTDKGQRRTIVHPKQVRAT